MAQAAIRLEHVEKSYGKHKVLTDVSLEIPKGDIFGLVGRNGAGKTTIFKVILGLSEFESGTLVIGEEGEPLDKGRQKIGSLVGTNFFDYLNGRQNLEYYRQAKGIPDKKEVDRVLEIVGLDKAKGPFKNYSLGMKQRLGIANAILGNPEILILDEPTNGLDPQGIADVRGLVQKLNQEYGMTVIISSHILGELQHTANRFGILNAGHVAKIVSQEDLILDQRTVRIRVDDLEKAREALKDVGVAILNEEMETQSLEDYYFDIVGANPQQEKEAKQ